MMEARMKNPVAILPEALEALLALDKSPTKEGLPYVMRKLVHLGVSQINGCSVCVDMYARELKKADQSEERIFAVAAWRETPYFTEPERAALAVAEALTRVAGPSRCRTKSGTRRRVTTTMMRSQRSSCRSRSSTPSTVSTSPRGRSPASGPREKTGFSNPTGQPKGKRNERRHQDDHLPGQGSGEGQSPLRRTAR